MAFTFDPEKSDKNVAQRNLSFDLVEHLEWEKADVVEDMRRDYGELRLQVLAPMGERLYAVVVTPRGQDLRVIRFRKASKRESDWYGKKYG